jgi:hypothetical protein
MCESAGIIKIDVAGPLNRVQVLCGSSVAGGVLSVACEGRSLREHSSRSERKEAAKQTSDEKANAASALPRDITCPNKHEILQHLVERRSQIDFNPTPYRHLEVAAVSLMRVPTR